MTQILFLIRPKKLTVWHLWWNSFWLSIYLDPILGFWYIYDIILKFYHIILFCNNRSACTNIWFSEFLPLYPHFFQSKIFHVNLSILVFFFFVTYFRYIFRSNKNKQRRLVLVDSKFLVARRYAYKTTWN